MSFVNLHAHSHYSLLDGFGKPEDIILRSKELGYPAAALTDHGVTHGLIEFFKAGKKHKIKPILGCEFYVANRTRFDKEAKVDVKPYHLTVLAKNNVGYENILKLTTKANLEGFYYKPRIDYGLLKAYGEGLVVLSGCISSHLSRSILNSDEDEIKRIIELHIEIFGKENYFLEMQDQPLVEHQQIVNARLKELAKEYDLGLVVTCDSHYCNPSDSDVHDILLCIQTGSTVHDEHRMRYTGDYSIRDINDLRQAFQDCPEAIDNTVKIAEMCNVDFEFGVNLIPSFDTPQNEPADVYLRELCDLGLTNRMGETVPDEYKDRLDYELKMVNSMGFDTYFLIVSDFVRYAKRKGIVVGPGRGSAAGSIIAWVLDITDVDPIAHGLFFERFLNPERISMPDIDIDFADHRRDEVLSYVVEKYGRDNVAQIVTFGTMAPRAAIRDSGRALGYPYSEVDALSKTVPPPILGKNEPLKDSIENDPALRREYNGNPRAKALLDYAIRLEGTVRHVGTHACAVVISEKELTHYTALQYGASGGGEIVTQYSAKPLEDLGLLKMDFLGLRNLTVIERTSEIVKRTRGDEIDIAHLPMDDEETFKLLQRGDTTGVFQLESGGMKRYLKELKPTRFEDIVAMGALYRPGPMEWIPTYIKGKHDPDSVKYLHPSFKSILESTYGVAVYQEQILQLARDFAGFSLGEADILRKAVGKKDPKLLVKQREKFVEGSVANDHKEKFAREVFENVIEPFAGYGFNKAHAVCYGLIAYQTAYLKAHYPVEFMTALLCSDSNNTERVVLEIKECSEMGISVLPPSINESFGNFTVVNENTVRFGLLAIKGIGEGPVSEIIEERDKNGKFKSLDDFARRISSKNLNKKLIQAAAYSGALDEWGDRKQLAENYDEISKYSKGYQQSVTNGQTDIFGMMGDAEDTGSFQMRNVPPATRMENLRWEKDFLGMYVSGHPLQGLRPYISRKGTLIGNLTDKKVGKNIKVVGLVSEMRKILTKSGNYMAVFSIEDPSGKVSAVVFPKTMNALKLDLADDMLLVVSGKFDNRRGGEYQLICDQVKPLSIGTMVSNAKEAGQFDEDDKSASAVRLIDDILADLAENEPEIFSIEVPSSVSTETMTSLKKILTDNKGDTEVELVLQSANKKIKLPFGINLSDELRNDINSLLGS